MPIFEFKCDKCGNKKDFFGSYEDSKLFEANVCCECSGKHVRQVAPIVAIWKTDTGTVSHGRQNMTETEKKGGGK